MVPEGNQSTNSGGARDDGAHISGGTRRRDGAQRERHALDSRLERRSVLKLIGASAVPLVAGTASASEPASGYGTGGFGAGAYGGGTADDGSGDSGASEAPLENTILFDGLGTTGVSEYEFAVTGDVEPSTAGGASINDQDTIDGGRVTGSVRGWRDAFQFSGDLDTLTVDGQARVYVNGTRVDPADYGGEQSRVLTVVGNGVHSEYELASDGSVTVLEGDGVAVVSEGRAEGTIERGVHQIRLSGTLTDITFLEGGTQVYLDDQRIDPADYDGQETLPHVLVLDGTDTTSSTSYSFAIDGAVSPSEYRDASIDGTDSIENTTVTGVVDPGTSDAYWFDGSIVDFKLVGDASIDIEHDVRS